MQSGDDIGCNAILKHCDFVFQDQLLLFQAFDREHVRGARSLQGVNGIIKIAVFLTTVLIIVTIMGALMHVVESGEGGNHRFSSMPESMYWAVVTMTTVGYGDITPETPVGKFLSAMMMIIGYSLIIIPTGIISAEMASTASRRHMLSTQHCPHCSRDGHERDAKHCKFCGGAL